MPKTAAIIHTTPATLEPLRKIALRLLPGVTIRNYLDDSLLPEINRDGFLSPSVKCRFFSLVQSAALGRPDAMLCACSSVGELVEELRGTFLLPFLRIDEPMAEKAAAFSGRVTVCATLPSTLKPTLQLIERKIREQNSKAQLESCLIEGAGALLNRGDIAGYDALLKGSLQALASKSDLIVLAQASMARAAETLPEADRAKFLASPESGMKALAALFE